MSKYLRQYDVNFLLLKNGLLSRKDWDIFVDNCLNELMIENQDVLLRLKNADENYYKGRI